MVWVIFLWVFGKVFLVIIIMFLLILFVLNGKIGIFDFLRFCCVKKYFFMFDF